MVNLLKKLQKTNMHELEKLILKKWSNKFDHFSLTIGLSGGIDSMVLLHLLHRLKTNLKINTLEAIHINHGISQNANNWEEFCINECNKLNIRIKTVRYTISKNGGESLENNARIARYTEFDKLTTNSIALAHHKLDQIETTLSQIMRGSSLHNIAGMLPLSQKKDKTYWRPLLDIDKQLIKDYAITYNISFIEDESNQDISYLRNFIRLKLYPLMTEYDEHIDNKIINLTHQIQDITAQLDEISRVDFNLIYQENKLDYLKLINLNEKRQFNVLVMFLKNQALAIPSNARLTEFIRQINNCAIDKKPLLIINDKHKLIKDKKFIYLTIV